MSRLLGRRITSAHVIAVVALFVSLTGTVYVVTRINGHQIRKHPGLDPAFGDTQVAWYRRPVPSARWH